MRFKEFLTLLELENAAQNKSGDLSSKPGYGWLKSSNTQFKLNKIKGEKRKLQDKSDPASTELSSELDDAEAELAPKDAAKPTGQSQAQKDNLQQRAKANGEKFKAGLKGRA